MGRARDSDGASTARIVRRAVLAALAVGLLSSPTALAAFPGRDGELAVQPSSGGGIELVRPDGAGANRICAQATLCGRPVAPRFSPNGRGIVFQDATTGQVGIVAPDGTCLWCLIGRRLTGYRGSAAQFAADDAVTLVHRPNAALDRVRLAGGRAERVAAGRVSAAVSSAGGELAFVRGTEIDVRAADGAQRRLTRGAAPAWSPTGSSLAFDRGGQVWTIGIARARARPRRLARGSSPAWSPDGHRIAYLGAGGRLYTISASGGPRTAVGTVRGRSVDWQPLPRRRDPCGGGPGRVVAQNAEAVVREHATGSRSSAQVSFSGCLRLTGVRRTLLHGPHYERCQSSVDLAGVAIAGRFATLGLHACDHAGPSCQDSVIGFDLGGGARSTLSSTTDGSCQRAIDSVHVSSVGFSAWRVSTSLGPAYAAVTAIACPTASLCVAGDENSNVVTSTDPSGGAPAWVPTGVRQTPLNPITGISCPTAGFCLATTAGGVLTSTDPTGGPGAWTFAAVDLSQRLGEPSCPTVSFCAVAVNGPASSPGQLLISTDPTGGPTTWTETQVSAHGLSGLSCPTAGFCAATDAAGEVIVSQSPAAGAATWTATQLPVTALGHVSCASTSLCVAQGPVAGELLASADPGAPTPAWVPTALGGSEPLSQISCATASLCVAAGDGPALFTSADPAGGAAAWTASTLPGRAEAVGLSCPSASLCAIASADGHALVSTDPLAGAYTAIPIDGAPCFEALTACRAERLYVHDDRGTRVLDAAPYGSGAVIGNVALAGNSLTATWAHAGSPRLASLG